ncbi:MAG: helix-turn-helix transcriptional regulator [Bdellovibrionota bacterium]
MAKASRISRKEVGAFIKALRKQKGWNQTDLSKILGMTQSNLSKIENGLADLGFAEFVLLAQAAKFSKFNQKFL